MHKKGKHVITETGTLNTNILIVTLSAGSLIINTICNKTNINYVCTQITSYICILIQLVYISTYRKSEHYFFDPKHLHIFENC